MDEWPIRVPSIFFSSVATLEVNEDGLGAQQKTCKSPCCANCVSASVLIGMMLKCNTLMINV